MSLYHGKDVVDAIKDLEMGRLSWAPNATTDVLVRRRQNTATCLGRLAATRSWMGKDGWSPGAIRGRQPASSLIAGQ